MLFGYDDGGGGGGGGCDVGVMFGYDNDCGGGIDIDIEHFI